jgi:hypothetical protein
MTLDIMDYVELWPRFEVREVTGPPEWYNSREIYSDAYGGGIAEIPEPAHKAADITSITVWSVYRPYTPTTWVSSLTVRYGDGVGAKLEEVGKEPATDAKSEGPLEGALQEIQVDTGLEIDPERSARIYGIKCITRAGQHLDSGALNPRGWDGACGKFWGEELRSTTPEQVIYRFIP